MVAEVSVGTETVAKISLFIQKGVLRQKTTLGPASRGIHDSSRACATMEKPGFEKAPEKHERPDFVAFLAGKLGKGLLKAWKPIQRVHERAMRRCRGHLRHGTGSKVSGARSELNEKPRRSRGWNTAQRCGSRPKQEGIGRGKERATCRSMALWYHTGSLQVPERGPRRWRSTS